MEEQTNLKSLTKEVADILYDSKNLLEILYDLIEGERKEDFIVSSLMKNIDIAFNDIEKCRTMISFPD